MTYLYNRLIEKVSKLEQSKKYIFRGGTHAKHLLIPKAFRPDIIRDISNQFPHSKFVINEWISEIIAIQESQLKASLSLQYIERIKRICFLLITNLRYNHAIYKAYEERGFPKNCNDEKLTNIFTRGQEGHWSEKSTFFDYFDRFCMLAFPPQFLDGKSMHESYIMEDVTGLDESYPQHYDFNTSALDWSMDPFKALFFTLNSDSSISNTSHLAIYALKIINTEDSPILIAEKDHLKDNPRAVAQNGTFSYFKQPCSFYLNHGEFPSIEAYTMSTDIKIKQSFELIKLPLRRSRENIKAIQKVLFEKKIDAKSLLLE